MKTTISEKSIAFFFSFLMIFISCSVPENDNIEYNYFEKSTSYSDFTELMYIEMMDDLRDNLNAILELEKPSDMNLTEFKIKLLDGELTLNSETEEQLNNVIQPLINYGLAKANNHNLEINYEDNGEIMATGGLFSPDDLHNGDPLVDFPSDGQVTVMHDPGLTWGEVGWCIAAGIGADALYSLAISGGTTWSAAALTTVFSRVASRFLGPIGVAIAVVSFGVCLAREAAD